MKQDDKDKSVKINTAFLNYSNKDTDTVEIRSDDTFIDVVKRNKPIKRRLIAIAVIAFFIIIIWGYSSILPSNYTKQVIVGSSPTRDGCKCPR